VRTELLVLPEPSTKPALVIRRLVGQRRIAFTYSGRRVILAEADIEAYLDANRKEPIDLLREARRRPA